MNNIGHDAKEMLDAIDEKAKLLQKKMNIRIEGNEDFAGISSVITRDDMNEIAEKWDMGKLTKLKKTDFAEVIKDEIIKNIKEKLTKTDESILLVLNKVLENNGVIIGEKTQEIPDEVVFYLKNNGILFVGKDENEQTAILIPVDMREAIFNAVNDEELIKIANENSLILRISRGIIYYNGIVALESLTDLVSKLTKKDFSADRIKLVIAENEDIISDLKTLDDIEGLEKYTMIASSKLSNPVQMIQAQNANGLEYQGFRVEELLEAGEANYCEWDEAHNKLFKHILDNYDVAEGEATAVVSAVIFGLKDGAGIEENLNVLDACFIFESAQEKKTFEKMLVAVQNDTRLWALRGHMPSEFKVATVVKSEKVGRNELCPCGSGKKYKKCCGK